MHGQQTYVLSNAWIGATIAAICFEVLCPLALGILARRKLGAGWRYFLYGALIFFVFQIATRVPIVTLIGYGQAPAVQSSPAILMLWLTFLAVTAGLFEEGGRWLGYRWLMGREEKTWNKAVMYGLGHGGLESIVLVGGGTLVSLLGIRMLSKVGINALPQSQRETVAHQLAVLSSQPAWMPLLSAYERLWAIAIQAALSVIVLQVFRRGNLRWLWIAIAAHALVDFTSVVSLRLLGPEHITTAFATEGLITVYGLIALWIIWTLRDEPAATAAQAAAR